MRVMGDILADQDRRRPRWRADDRDAGTASGTGDTAHAADTVVRQR
jgi:hypothetical protein